jgi:DnaK suppressor protein
MNQLDLRQRIEEEIENTRLIIENYKEKTQPTPPDCAVDTAMRMDAMQHKNIYAASLLQAELKLQNLKKVLESIGTSDFGICRKCKQPIPIARILIRPESLYCVRCTE